MDLLEKDLVWVPKELAEKINEIDDPFSNECLELIEGYIETSKDVYKVSLSALDEDLLMYKGLMIQAKQKYEVATKEQSALAYEVFEKMDENLPHLRGKVDDVVNTLKPLEDKLKSINTMIDNISLHKVKSLLDTLERIDNLLGYGGKTADIIKFLFNNYSDEGV